MYFSIVVPTFGRPDEVTELLESLVNQQYKEFEVILADGSSDNTVKQIADKYITRLILKHLHRPGLGISESRNLGVKNARGEIIVFFDSDCIIPPQYLEIVKTSLLAFPLDAYGGPDKADHSFNNTQKAISYAMTSLFTTGGIRGKKKHVGQYQPRSFNMGIRKDVFNALGGYSGLKVSEDIDLSIRLVKSGYRSGLLDDAYVFHKRRSTFYKFFRQVLSFGSGRIDLQLRHGDALKLVHLLPSLFTTYFFGGIIFSLFSKCFFWFWLSSLLTYSVAVLIDSSVQNRSLKVGFMSVYAAFVMLIGYGLGMIKAVFLRILFKSKKESEKPEITKGS